jgi:hypothetical protein
VLRQVGQPLPSENESAIAVSDAVQIVQEGQSSAREPVRRPLPPVRKPFPEGVSMELELPGSGGSAILRPVRPVPGMPRTWAVPAAAVRAEAADAPR